MSKMSQLHMELTEQANELGFDTLEDAMSHGYSVDYAHHKLVDEQANAHEDYIKRKEEVLTGLLGLKQAYLMTGERALWELIEKTIQLIQEGEK